MRPVMVWFQYVIGNITYEKNVIKMRKKGYKIIMWDVLSGDFDQGLSKESCLEHTIKHISNGSIVVFHDSVKSFKNLDYVLPKVLEHFKQKGFRFKSL